MNRRDAETQSQKYLRFGDQRRSKNSYSRFLRVSAPLRLAFIAAVFVAGGCSIPNLEKPQCTEARDAVKRFYSFHFGNDMKPSADSLKASEQFLTAELFKTLAASTDTAKDYFTATDNYPKAFRVGECRSDTTDNANFQVLLLWRTDMTSEQKEVRVETVKTGDKWLVNKVSN